MVGNANTHRVYRIDEVETFLRDWDRLQRVALGHDLPGHRSRKADLFDAHCATERIPEEFRNSQYANYVASIDSQMETVKFQEAENQRASEEGLIPVHIGSGGAMAFLYGASQY